MSAPCCVFCYELGCCGKSCRASERAILGQSDKRWLNCLCSPVALFVHSFYSYFWVCLGVYLQRLLNHFFCFLCIRFNVLACCFQYRDRGFKANDTSLGIKAEEEGIEWKRSTDVLKRPVLFQQSVAPTDVVQGSLQNCWLLSTFACMAEFPALVDKVFVNREYSYRGKYKVTLYNSFIERWQVVTVDDYFPFKRKTIKSEPKDIEEGGGKEKEDKAEGEEAKKEEVAEKVEYKWAYAQPQDNELWVPVLEKAFAKFRGNYAKLSGGNMLWAFQALTGDEVFRLSKVKEGDRAGVWERFILATDIRPSDDKPISVKHTGHSYKHNQLFDLLRTYDRSKALIGASMAAGAAKDGFDRTDEKLDNGLIVGHAYSVLQVKRVKKFELIQLRNPWGHFEWKGDWSDESPKWEEHPEVANLLKHVKDPRDGTFWMEYGDFAEVFENIDICDRTVNFKDFHLDVHEDPTRPCRHWLGPTIGCVKGCFSFWCKCQGICTLYCGNKTSEGMKKASRGRDDGIAAAMGI